MTPLRTGAIVTDDMAAHIYAGVAGKVLPRPEWTHPAHLVFAAALLGHEGLMVAERRAPSLIRGYNESVGGVNDDRHGYHHTITLFFLRHIDEFLALHTNEAIGARATRLLASPLAEPEYPLRFYSRERLFSVEARKEWVGPDLT
ncbi:MAG: hypothetical protein U5J99_01190 [Parvularculaceae bacterium]|nr:hypothetical protein [Parvularculaceae bacterium]